MVLHNGQVRPAEDIINTAGTFLQEYQHTCKALSLSPKSLNATSKGWINPPPGSLKLNSDASIRNGKGFIGVGAIIRDSSVFEYNNQFHNLKRVTLQDFRSCNATWASITVYSSGSDSINLKGLCHYYFLGDYPGHCQAGQKIDILVTPSSFRSRGSQSSAPYALPPSGSSSTMTQPPIPAKINSASSRSSFKLWHALALLCTFCCGFRTHTRLVSFILVVETTERFT
ncbi:hypothetical protein Q3G72_018511 [Acer saccharum]|nr:hypothetical protein Q3G72_018511 [Acer saccharum]